MLKKLSIASGALALCLVGSSAFAEGWSMGNILGVNDAPMDRSQIRLPGHNRYQPYAAVEEQQAAQVYSSGYYTSTSRSAGVHNRYTN